MPRATRLAAIAAALALAGALPTPIPVFTAHGGTTYRIPSLVRTAAGTLIAFAEARTGGDCASKTIVSSRSEDGGRSWGAQAPVAGSPGGVTGNPTAVFDAVTGRVVLALASGGCNPATATAVLDDAGSDGRAWGAPRTIPLGAHSGSLPGPGTAAQLPSGRLIFPAHYGAYGTDIVLFSDDHGASWQASPTLLPQMDEAAIAVVPGSNSSLVAQLRNNHLSPRKTVAWSTSQDAGATWSLPVTYDNPLLTPVCQASLVALEGALYFSGPRSATSRTNITILRSADGGASWGSAEFQVQAGSSNGYSCMASGSAVLPGLGGILYEGLGSIAFAHFPLSLQADEAAPPAPAPAPAPAHPPPHAAAAAEPPWTGSTRPARLPPALDCPLRRLIADYAGALNSAVNASDVARSLRLAELCPNSTARAPPPAHHQPPRPRWEAPAPAAGLCSLTAPPPIELAVAPPPAGSDAAPGTLAAPFATLERALGAVAAARAGALAGAGSLGDAAAAAAAALPACIWLRSGTWRVTSADAPILVSQGNLEIAGYPGEAAPLLTGALLVPTPQWAPYASPAAPPVPGAACWVARAAAPPGLRATALYDAAAPAPSAGGGDTAGSGLLTGPARAPNSPYAHAPYPAAWAGNGTVHAWALPPPAQRCESQVLTLAAPCFANFTEQGGMDACFQARIGCGAARFEPPTQPGTPRSVCGGALSQWCNAVPGGLNVSAAALGAPPFPWAHPEDAQLHAMKRIAPGYGWYSLAWEVSSTQAEGVTFGRGGFQSSQGRVADGGNFDFFFQGALELLDAPGEHHYDTRTGDVYLCAAAALAARALPRALELAVAPYLLAVAGAPGAPVANVSLRGLRLARSASTMLAAHGVPGGGDLAAHARGALTLGEAEGVTVAGCAFEDIGGSAVVVAGHAAGVQVVDSAVYGAGAHGVLVLGSSALVDATGWALPRGVRVAGNVVRDAGRENKFAAPVAVALAPRALVEGNVVYQCPRTAVYYNDLSGSPGQALHNNALFNANRETTDTGPVYTYQRLAFLGDNAAGPGVEPDVALFTGNLLAANYGSTWNIDEDDGTFNVVDSANALLFSGAKQYLGSRTTHADNYYVYADASDGSFPSCNMQDGAEQYRSGYGHVFANNTCVMALGTRAYAYNDCDVGNAASPPRIAAHNNTYLSAAGANLSAVTMACGPQALSLAAWQAASGSEAGSRAGPLPDPEALALQLWAFLPGPQAGGSGRRWGA